MPTPSTADQIRSFQDYFDALMSGNLARRRQTQFMPADFRLIETRQPPLKDQYDEWLARLICYAFSVPVSPFVSQVNRATGETLRQQATQEGLVPLKAWVKNALDRVIQVCMAEPGLEFVWVGDDAIDPLEQAQTPAGHQDEEMRVNELGKRWDAEMGRQPIRIEMTFVDGFLVLGAGTRLAKIGGALDEKRLGALLIAAHGRPSSASSRIHIRRALGARRDDHLPLALIHIALSGAAKLAYPKEDAQRLFMADELMEADRSPRDR